MIIKTTYLVGGWYPPVKERLESDMKGVTLSTYEHMDKFSLGPRTYMQIEIDDTMYEKERFFFELRGGTEVEIVNALNFYISERCGTRFGGGGPLYGY